MASPYKKPTHLKALEGTRRKDREVPNEMKLPGVKKIPRAPKHFKGTTAAKEWRKVTKKLFVLGMLFEEDLPQLQAYCFSVYMLELAQQKLTEQNLLASYKNKAGHVYQAKNKWITIYNESIDKVVKLAAQFGFSPSSRTKISMPPTTKDDPLNEL